MAKHTISEHREFISWLQQKEERRAAKNIRVTLLFFALRDEKPKDENRLVTYIYRSSHLATHGDYPTILHIRGTGYNASARYHAYLTCSHLAEKSSCQVIEIDHHLAPEHPCPIGFNDIYSSIKYIIKHAKLLQIDLEKIAILGYSSGGNFAALAAIQSKKDKLPIALQVLVSPVTDLSLSLTKFSHFEDKDNFPLSLKRWFIELYLPDTCDPRDPSISPYWSKELNNLPATFFLFGEFDRFRSDSEGYRDKLNEVGVWTHTSIFKKENHSFFWSNMRALETVAVQVRLGFNLFSVPKTISIYRKIKQKVFEQGKEKLSLGI